MFRMRRFDNWLIPMCVVAGLMLVPGVNDAHAEPGDDSTQIEQLWEQESESSAGAVEILDITSAAHLTINQDYEYRIGPGDLLAIEVFMVDELSHVTRVNSKGLISLPLVGTIPATGLTVEQIERDIEHKLGENYLRDPHVSVFVKEYESQKVTVNGWVKQPGIFPLKGKTTLLEAISMARGLERLSDPTEVVIFRNIPHKGTVGYKINLEQVQTGEVLNPVLQTNDIVVVPKDGSQAAIDEARKNLRVFLGFIPFF